MYVSISFSCRFVEENGFGAFERRPAAIGALVADWLADPTALAAM